MFYTRLWALEILYKIGYEPAIQPVIDFVNKNLKKKKDRPGFAVRPDGTSREEEYRTDLTAAVRYLESFADKHPEITAILEKVKANWKYLNMQEKHWLSSNTVFFKDLPIE